MQGPDLREICGSCTCQGQCHSGISITQRVVVKHFFHITCHHHSSQSYSLIGLTFVTQSLIPFSVSCHRAIYYNFLHSSSLSLPDILSSLARSLTVLQNPLDYYTMPAIAEKPKVAPTQGVGPDYRSESQKPTATVSTGVEFENVTILPQTPQLIALLTCVPS